MDVNKLNIFIEAFGNVMPQLGFSKIRHGNLSLKNQDLACSGIIIIVGLVGEIKGNVVYVIDDEAAKQIASTMMMGMPVNEIDDMARSALSELTNMVTANATICATKIGLTVDISTPTLLQGTNISVRMQSSQVVCIPLFADEIPMEINIAYQS